MEVYLSSIDMDYDNLTVLNGTEQHHFTCNHFFIDVLQSKNHFLFLVLNVHFCSLSTFSLF